MVDKRFDDWKAFIVLVEVRIKTTSAFIFGERIVIDVLPVYCIRCDLVLD